MSGDKLSSPANDDDLCECTERDHVELRGLLKQTQFLLRRTQQVIDRTRICRSKGNQEQA